MGLIISASEDFSFGRYSINDDDNTRQNLKEYVRLKERYFLNQLLGIELAGLLIADLDQYKMPQDPRFSAIFDPLSYEVNNELCYSEGIREILKGLIYSEFTREQNHKNTINGNAQDLYPQGELISSNMAGLTAKYNSIMDSFYAVQYFCIEHKDVYPE